MTSKKLTLAHIFATLAHILAQIPAICHDFEQDIDCFLCQPKKASLYVNLRFGQSYESEKLPLSHPFKLYRVANL